jgi:hypothetical protein
MVSTLLRFHILMPVYQKQCNKTIKLQSCLFRLTHYARRPSRTCNRLRPTAREYLSPQLSACVWAVILELDVVSQVACRVKFGLGVSVAHEREAVAVVFDLLNVVSNET